jgi:histidine ammonia-lyase
VATGQPTVYGINTGFGIFAARHIPHDQADRLSRNLIMPRHRHWRAVS